MHLNFGYSESTQIPSLADFQTKLKQKYSKKNEILQISQFNSKGRPKPVNTQISSSSFSQADFKSSKTQEQKTKKQDFFEQEGNKLLGRQQQQSTKQLCLRKVLIALLVHITLFVMGFKTERSRILMFGDFLMLTLNLYILSEKKLRFSNEFKVNLYRIYYFLLIISITCLCINLVYSALLKQNKAQLWNLLLLVLSFLGIGCEIKLRKQTKYVIFMTQQINRKQSPEEMDLSDQI